MRSVGGESLTKEQRSDRQKEEVGFNQLCRSEALTEFLHQALRLLLLGYVREQLPEQRERGKKKKGIIYILK